MYDIPFASRVESEDAVASFYQIICPILNQYSFLYLTLNSSLNHSLPMQYPNSLRLPSA